MFPTQGSPFKFGGCGAFRKAALLVVRRRAFTVGDFLGRVNHEMAQKLPDASVASLDECLQRFPGLSENRHAAPGTAVPTWLLHVVWCHSLAHPTGVVWFYYAYHAATCTNVLSCTVSLAMSLLV